jgi:hypothetical protein
MYNTTIKNVTDRVQPRIGFSWSPMSGTVFRGGYGIFTGLNQGSTYYNMRVENGEYQLTEIYYGCGHTASTGACTSVPSLVPLFPNVAFPTPGPSLSGALKPVGGATPQLTPITLPAGSGSFHGLSPNFVPPLTHEMDFSVEQQLPYKTSLSIGYVGARALRLPVFTDGNLIGQSPHGSRSFSVTGPGATSIITVPYYLPGDRINTALSSLNVGFSVANSWYNSLVTTIRRPFDHGFELLLNHTWSRAMDDDMVQGAFGTFFGGNTVLDPNHLKGEYGRADIDMRNRFVGTVIYKPQVFESNKIVKYALDGFTLSGTATESTGTPIVASMSGTVTGGDDGNIYGGAMSSSSGAATTGRPPQIQRNSQLSPGVRNIDFRITRDLPIYKTVSMQFIAEAFNIFNHEIWSGENSTYSTYTAYSPTGACNTAGVTGCITPYVASTAAAAFGQKSSTSNVLYGPRQLQVSAKLFF